MIAMFLPLPIVIVDPELAMWQKVGAFVGPGTVQGYVGNALEPILFGKSLNMTPLSILAALVIWSALWGLMGAIFSVPLLGVMKILLSHTNHPMAKYVIMLIREDATVDEQAEASKSPAPGGGKDGAAGGE
jgi:predicted PurR-regulated permease PerM